MNVFRFRVLAPIVALVGAAFVVVFIVAPSSAADSSEIRTVSGFSRVRITGAFKTTIAAGASQTRVTVTGTPDALRRITTEVESGTLVVGMKSGTNVFSTTPSLSIEVPVLRGFRNEGAGSAKISGLGGEEIAIENAGAASIDAAGRCAGLRIELDGVGRIDTTNLAARDVTVDNNGVGSVHVRASGQLTMNVNGVGEIRYSGDPTHIESHVNGVGRIGRL